MPPLSLVAEDDLIARALVLAELKHRPFLDLLAEIGEREVFAVLIDPLDMRGEPPGSADIAAVRIRTVDVARDSDAMRAAINEREMAVRDATITTRNKGSVFLTGSA